MFEIIYDSDSKPIIIDDFEVIIVDRRCLDEEIKNSKRFWYFGKYTIILFTYNDEFRLLQRYIIKCLLLDFNKNIGCLVDIIEQFIVVYDIDNNNYKIYNNYDEKISFITNFHNYDLVYVNIDNLNYKNICLNNYIAFDYDKIIKLKTDNYKVNSLQ